MNARISELAPARRWTLLLAFGAVAVLSLEMGNRAHRAWRSFPPPLERPLPKGLTRLALAAALGDQPRVAADFSYIDCLQYIGGPAQDGFYGQTFVLYSQVQWLDPNFHHAVREGISLLGWMLRRPDEALELGRRAVAADPTYARYGAYMAALAYQKHLDSEGVLQALQDEIQRPDAPDMVLRMVGNLLLKEHAWDRAERYWAWAAGRMKTDENKDFALRSLEAARRHQVRAVWNGKHGI